MKAPPSRSGRSSTITRCCAGAWSGAPARSARRRRAASRSSGRWRRYAAYLDGEILPHAEAEERTLYQAAATQARGSELVRALTAEHHELAYLAGRLQPGADGAEAATVAEWIATLFAGHVAKENDLLLPALTGSGADLAALLADMHEPQPSLSRAVSQPVACCHRHRPRRREIIMYPDSALSAGQLAIMAVVVVLSLAAWLIAVFLAARQPRGTSAAVNAGPP